MSNVLLFVMWIGAIALVLSVGAMVESVVHKIRRNGKRTGEKKWRI